MRTMIARLRMLAERENGQTMAEYSIVLAVITIAAVAALARPREQHQRRARTRSRRSI